VDVQITGIVSTGAVDQAALTQMIRDEIDSYMSNRRNIWGTKDATFGNFVPITLIRNTLRAQITNNLAGYIANILGDVMFKFSNVSTFVNSDLIFTPDPSDAINNLEFRVPQLNALSVEFI
jgi:hypothetical protein